MMGFPLSFSAQTAPSLKELVDAAMSKDAAIEQQNLESKANGLDQQKLKDIFLPKVEISGFGKSWYKSNGLCEVSGEFR